MSWFLKISTFISLGFFSIVNFERNELNDMNTQRRANGTARIKKSAPDFWIEGEPKRTRHEPPSGERKTLHFQNKYSSYARSSWI